MATSVIRRQANRGFRALEIPSKSSITITVSNPCFLFASGSNEEFTVALCSGNIITNISGNNPQVEITKPTNFTLNIVNNFSWRIIAWILDYV